MDEPAINQESIRKRARTGDNKCIAPVESPSAIERTGLATLPVEILLKILSDLYETDFYNVSQVSRFFKTLTNDPILWQDFEVAYNDGKTGTVIKHLKTMTLLKTFTIEDRKDTNVILRQLPLTNKNLSELYISRCRGSRARFYLRPAYLTRILRKCRQLHTICISSAHFRSRKFYRLLGGMATRLREAFMLATPAEFCTFVNHVQYITKKERREICARFTGEKHWITRPFYYDVDTQSKDTPKAIIQYFGQTFTLLKSRNGTA